MTRRFGAKKWAVGFAPASFALGKKHFDTWFEVASFQFCMFNQRGHVHCCGCNFAMAKQLQPFCRTASLNPSLLYFCHFVFVGSASDWAGTLKVCSWAILELWCNDMLLVRCVTALPAHRSWQNCWIEGVFSFASWLWISCLIMGLLVVCVSHDSNVCDVCLFSLCVTEDYASRPVTCFKLCVRLPFVQMSYDQMTIWRKTNVFIWWQTLKKIGANRGFMFLKQIEET